jgi:hypothetical protein
MSHSKNVVPTGCNLPTARARVAVAMVLLTRLRAKERYGLLWVGYVESPRGVSQREVKVASEKKETKAQHQLQ